MAEKVARGWNTTSHESLLFAVLEEFKPNKVQITSITDRMQQMGYTFTFNAVKYLALSLAFNFLHVCSSRLLLLNAHPPLKDIY